MIDQRFKNPFEHQIIKFNFTGRFLLTGTSNSYQKINLGKGTFFLITLVLVFLFSTCAIWRAIHKNFVSQKYLNKISGVIGVFYFESQEIF